MGLNGTAGHCPLGILYHLIREVKNVPINQSNTPTMQPHCCRASCKFDVDANIEDLQLLVITFTHSSKAFCVSPVGICNSTDITLYPPYNKAIY